MKCARHAPVNGSRLDACTARTDQGRVRFARSGSTRGQCVQGQAVADSLTERTELILERGAVALGPLATGRAQLRARMCVPEDGVRVHLHERAHHRPAAARARLLHQVRRDRDGIATHNTPTVPTQFAWRSSVLTKGAPDECGARRASASAAARELAARLVRCIHIGTMMHESLDSIHAPLIAAWCSGVRKC